MWGDGFCGPCGIVRTFTCAIIVVKQPVCSVNGIIRFGCFISMTVTSDSNKRILIDWMIDWLPTLQIAGIATIMLGMLPRTQLHKPSELKHQLLQVVSIGFLWPVPYVPRYALTSIWSAAAGTVRYVWHVDHRLHLIDPFSR